MYFLTCAFLAALSFAPETFASCALPLMLDIRTSFPQGWSGHTEMVSYANGEYGNVYKAMLYSLHEDRLLEVRFHGLVKFNLDFSEIKVNNFIGSVWIGDIKNETYSEPWLLSTTPYSNPPYHIIDQNFTSYHGSQYPLLYYIFPTASEPVSIIEDIPGNGAHGTPFPAGGSDYGFNINDTGYVVYDNENNFIGCQTPDEMALNTWQIYWAGDGTPTYPEGLNCTGPLYLRLGECGCNAL